MNPRPTPALSPRERELLDLAAQGFTDKQICVHLGLTLPTVRTHWFRVRKKLQASNRSQAVAMTLRMSDDPTTDSEAAIALLKNKGVGYWVWRPGARRMGLDRAAGRIFGLGSEPTVDLSRFLEAMLPADRPAFVQFLQRSPTGRPLETIDHRVNAAARFSHNVRTAKIANSGARDGEPCVLFASILESESLS